MNLRKNKSFYNGEIVLTQQYKQLEKIAEGFPIIFHES